MAILSGCSETTDATCRGERRLGTWNLWKLLAGRSNSNGDEILPSPLQRYSIGTPVVAAWVQVVHGHCSTADKLGRFPTT